MFCVALGKQSVAIPKPRLVRQHAVHEEIISDLSCSPPRLGVRFLPTIPSAADSSVVLEEESHNEIGAIGGASSAGTPFYTVLQSGNTMTTLSSPKNTKSRPP